MELFLGDPDCHEVVDHVEYEDEREVDGRGRDPVRAQIRAWARAQ